MAFKFYLASQKTNQPDNWQDLSSTIKRDKILKALLITQDATLIWTNNNETVPGEISAYSYIRSTYDESVCNEIPIDIYDEISATETLLVYTGIIKVPQLEFEEQPVSVNAKIQDNSFYSYISNNRELNVDLRATQTKNKVALSPIPAYSVDMFASFSGIYGSTVGALYKGYRISDVFAFIVAAITDNKVSFASNYLDNLENQLFLFKGQSLLNSYTLLPLAEEPVFEISFQTLFNEIDKDKNLFFYIDQTDPDSPVLRVENTEATYTGTVIHSFTGIKEMNVTADSSNLYSQVLVGSDHTASGSTVNVYTWNEATSYYGWKKETFYPLGQCNINQELNLNSSWVISSNAIQVTLMAGSTAFIDDYFIIECDTVDTVGLTAQAHRYDFFGAATPPYFYNFGLNNFAKLQRHSDKFETTFGTFLGLGGNGFRALLGDDDSQDITYMTGAVTNPNFIPPGGITVAAAYVNETTNGAYDGNNNYSNITFEYTLPVDGNYSFHHLLKLETGGLTGLDEFIVDARIQLFDPALVQKAISANSAYFYFDANYELDTTLVANGLAGDIVKGSYSITYNPNQSGNQQVARLLTVRWDSYLECNGTPEGGISITSGNRDIKKQLYTFTDTITPTEWVNFTNNPTGLISFEKDGIIRKGWIEEIQRNDWTGFSKIKLVTSHIRQ